MQVSLHKLRGKMKVLLVLSAVLLGCMAYPPSSEEAYVQWNAFKSNFQKSYGKSEDLQRLNIFVQNLKEIQEHNERFSQGLETYKQGINQFTDLTRDEFVDYVNSFKPGRPTRTNALQYRAPLNVELPETVDWRDKKVVTAVKNQGQCGSCWAFSTTGSLESQNSLINDVLIELSEQELVDCAGGKYGNAGCDGGFMDSAFDYVTDNGLSTEQSYPYEAVDGKCRRTDKAEAIRTSGYAKIKANDESDLKSAVATVGPISVAVDASYWKNYESGVYTDRNCGNDEDSLNHGVLAVGYGTENGQKYWLVKNSWGASWGESGYIKTARDSNNNCGIATDSSYPLL